MVRLDASVHEFTKVIFKVLDEHFGEYGNDVFAESTLLQYLDKKTVSANRGSKTRGSFANIYALYVVVEDYINKGFFDGSAGTPYAQYEGVRFNDLFTRQRELPFGARLQNHGLNHRLNSEYKKYFPTLEKPPIVRDVQTQRYWIQEDLLRIGIRLKDGKNSVFNIAKLIIDIIDEYAQTKRAAFDKFLDTCRQISDLGKQNPEDAKKFVIEQLSPNVDARVFEIVSYAILKERYGQKSVWIGPLREEVEEEFLVLYKTGRTNANDGGIDFVMKPLGRFFQVTETVDASKYFLDIDKVQRFPITFVIKSDESQEEIREGIREQAHKKYGIDSVVDSYMEAVEEIINTNDLVEAFNHVVESGRLGNVMNEIVTQSKMEFNYEN